MSEVETVDGEATELLPAVREGGAPSLLSGSTPVARIENATEVASALADVIEQRKLYKVISNKKFVLVEGWTLLGDLLGVFPITEWTRPTQDGWEARVVARTLAGAEVGAGEAMCSRREKRWKTADDYAIRSMAQTRAVSKALRLPLGFVMTLAGYEATPEAEVVENGTTPAAAAPENPSTWPALLDAYNRDLYPHPWQEWWIEAIQRVHGIKPPENATFGAMLKALKQIKGQEASDGFWQGCVNALDVMPRSDFGPTRDEVREAFAKVFEGVVLQGPLVTMSPDEAEFLPTYEMYVAGDHRPAAEASGSETGPSSAAADEGTAGERAEAVPSEPEGGAETGPSDTAPSGEPGVPHGVTAGAGLGEDVPAPSAPDPAELDEQGFPKGF